MSDHQTDEPILGGEPHNPDVDNLLSLDSAFKDYWGQVDAAHQPEAKAEEPSKEKVAQPSPAEDSRIKEVEPGVEMPGEKEGPKAGTKEGEIAKEEPKAEPEKDAEEEDDLEALQPPPNARPKTVADWHALKGKAKEYKGLVKTARSEAQTERQKAEALQKQFEEFKAKQAELPEDAKKELEDLRAFRAQAEQKKNEIPDDVKKELEEHRAFRAQHDLVNTKDFQDKYQKPISETFNSVMDDLTSLWGGGDDVKAVIGQIKAQLGPERIDKEWFRQQIFNNDTFKKADLFSQQEVAGKVRDLFKLREERDRKLQEANDPERYKQVLERQRQEQEARQKQFDDAYLKTAHETEQDLIKQHGDWAVLIDPKTAKDDADRSRIEAHNKDAQVYRQQIEKYIQALNTQDPVPLAKTHVNLIADALKATKMEKEISSLKAEQEKKDAEHKKEIERIKADADRISKENQKLTQVRGVPAKAGGVSSSTKSKPAIDIFTDNPFAHSSLGDE
jgi:hypothetical protein